MAGCVLLCAAFFGYIYLTSPQVVPFDEATLCPQNTRYIPHLEVLLFERNRRVDYVTKQFVPESPNTIRQVRREIERTLGTLPKSALIEIYEVNYDTGARFEPVARFCNPGDGSGVSSLTGNPRLAEQRYRELFLNPFRQIVEDLSGWSPDYRYSLVDSLGGVARLVLGNPEFEHASKSLTVLSDFVVPQNFATPGRVPVSFGDLGPSMRLGEFEDFADSGGMRFDFRGSAVRLLLNRMEYALIPDIQGPEHTQWWEEFFDSQNATVEEVVPVGEW